MTEKQAKKQLWNLMMLIGPGYHPDTNMKDYVNYKTGAPTFTDAKYIQKLNRMNNEVFDVLGDEMYDYGMKLQVKLFEKSQQPKRNSRRIK